MSARAALRSSTAAEHERVDRLFSALDLGRADDYRTFLRAQAAAFLPIEAALDAAGAAAVLEDWPARRRGDLLVDDLAVLGEAPPSPVEAPDFVDAASILGGIYVLEGSRLGGALLRRSLAAGAPSGFLQAPQQHGSWRKLLDKLDLSLYRNDLMDSAVGAAKQVFDRFERSGLRHLETIPA